MSHDFYSDAELLKIEAAGRLAVHGLQQLRDRDERKRAEPYVKWDAVSAGQETFKTDGPIHSESAFPLIERNRSS